MPGGAPFGNKNAAKSRLVEAHLRAMIQSELDKLGTGSRLIRGLNVILDRFAEGDIAAVQFVADRLDGKPRQAVDVQSEEGRLLNVRVSYGAAGQVVAEAVMPIEPTRTYDGELPGDGE